MASLRGKIARSTVRFAEGRPRKLTPDQRAARPPRAAMPETLMDIARSYSTDGSPKRLAREAVIAQVEIVRLIRARVRDLEGENKARQAAILSDTIMVTRLDRLARSTNGIKFRPQTEAHCLPAARGLGAIG